jgi:hypothetical protein
MTVISLSRNDGQLFEVDSETPWFTQLFEITEDGDIRINDTVPISLTAEGKTKGIHPVIWNMMIGLRDIKLWSEIGMKPTRSWKVTDFKNYWGIKGKKEDLYDRYCVIYDFVGPMFGLKRERYYA